MALSLLSIRTLLLAIAAGALVFSLVQWSNREPAKVYRIGLLSSGPDMDQIQLALRELGYVEGRNVAYEIRVAAGHLDRLRPYASELVESRVDVIVAGSPPAIQAAKESTSTIPIVMAFTSGDPVRSGFVQSYAHPGANITGVSIIADELARKRLEILKQVVPGAKRISVMMQPGHTAGPGQVEAARQSARSLDVEIDVIEVRDARDYDDAIASAAQRTDALFILANPTFAQDGALLGPLTTKHRIPTLCQWRHMAASGCLVSYGPDDIALNQRAASYVDRILRGARAADLPVEQPTKFELTINLATATILGLTISKPLQMQAELIR